MKKISVLGCGWLGLPLAKDLIKKGYKVKGSTTSEDKLNLLKQNGIEAFKIKISEKIIEGHIEGFLKDSEILIINIPPRLRQNPNANHVAEVQNLIPYIERSTVSKVFFVSSTSVYKDDFNFPKINNNTIPNATSNNGRQLYEVEQLLQGSTAFKTTVIRCSGLFDTHRHPGYFLSGKSNIKNPEAPINLIHQLDVITVIVKLLQRSDHIEVINLSYPYHPSKKIYYTEFCKSKNIILPNFNDDKKSQGKIIHSKFVEQLLDYKLEFKP